jgi:uncharacterized protein YbjT (DUF2867 family)
MHNYKNIAIAGATGGLGKVFITEFLKDKHFAVKALIRKESAFQKKDVTEELKHLGAEVVLVDYEDVKDLSRALHGVNVVISTLSGDGLQQAQLNLIKASKDSDVRRFIPSEFGLTHEGL